VRCFARRLVALGRRADDGRIDDRAFADGGTLVVEIARDRFKQAAIETMCDKQAAEAHKRRGHPPRCRKTLPV